MRTSLHCTACLRVRAPASEASRESTVHWQHAWVYSSLPSNELPSSITLAWELTVI